MKIYNHVMKTTFLEFLNEIKLTTDFTYYHGCSNEEHAQSILRDGYLKPGNEDVKIGNKLMPMIGRTYSTPDLREAVVYSIGGDFIGKEFRKSDYYRMRGDDGYLFQIDKNSFTDVIPDEDYVGQMIYLLNSGIPDKNYLDKDCWKKLSEWSVSKSKSYLWTCQSILTPLQYKKCIRYDDYADFAVAGKKLNKFISDEWKSDIIKLGVPIGNLGRLRFNKVWKFEKSKSKELDDDCENFFQIATKIL